MNGQWLAASTRTGTVTVWDLGRKSLLRQFNAHTGQVDIAGFLPGGNRLVTQDEVEFLREWDLTAGEQTRSWKVGRRTPACGLSDDGRWFVMIKRHRLALVNLTTGHQTLRDANAKRVRGTAVFSPDGKHAAAGSEDGYARVWETATLREVATIRGGGFSVAYSPDGKRLAIGGGAKEAAKLWDVEGHQELFLVSFTHILNTSATLHA